MLVPIVVGQQFVCDWMLRIGTRGKGDLLIRRPQFATRLARAQANEADTQKEGYRRGPAQPGYLPQQNHRGNAAEGKPDCRRLIEKAQERIQKNSDETCQHIHGVGENAFPADSRDHPTIWPNGTKTNATSANNKTISKIALRKPKNPADTSWIPQRTISEVGAIS